MLSKLELSKKPRKLLTLLQQDKLRSKQREKKKMLEELLKLKQRLLKLIEFKLN